MFKYKSLSFFVFLFLIVIGFFVKFTPAHALCYDPNNPPGFGCFNEIDYPVTITVPASATAGSTIPLTWSTSSIFGADKCTATCVLSNGSCGSGDWSGVKPYSGSTTITPSTPGTYAYDLECMRVTAGPNIVYTRYGYGSASLTVTAPPPPSTYTVSASTGTMGTITAVNSVSITPSPNASATTSGPAVNFTVSANSGYKINTSNVVYIGNPPGSWDNLSSPSVYTTPNITANGTYTFGFDPLIMSGTLTPASSTCIIAVGANTCTQTLAWTTTNPQGTSAVTSATGTPSPANGNNGSATFTIPYIYNVGTPNSSSPSYFTLYNNSVQLAQASVTPSCVVNTAWDTGTNTCKTTSAPINGVCGAYHYLCSSGTSSNNVDGASAWTWDCLGSNGGTNANPSCSETKPIDCAYPPCATPPTLPAVTTSTPTGITANGATGGGNTTSDGGSTVTQSGLVWSTMANPTTILNSGITYDGWAIGGPWTSSITGLSSSTTYHVRAYATNKVGTSYGSDVIFTTPSSLTMTGTLTPASPSCIIASGASSCNINFSWNTVNPVATSAVTKPVNVTVGSGNSKTNIPFSIKYSSETFYLYNNAILLAQSTVFSSCVVGTGWDPTSGTCKVGAPTCANGAVNYPTCTVDSNNNCINGATDPTTCTNITNRGGGGATDGSCSNPARHYTCASGTSGSNVNTPSQWTWTCNGTNGGASPSCTELKKKPKYIEN